MVGESTVDTVYRSLQHREAAIQLLKVHLQMTQQRMKVQADKRKTTPVFCRRFVFLNLQPYRQNLVVNRTNHKLIAKYYPLRYWPILVKCLID